MLQYNHIIFFYITKINRMNPVENAPVDLEGGKRKKKTAAQKKATEAKKKAAAKHKAAAKKKK
jgi:hypothetical protein